jgi:hypothetical protein
MIPIVLNENQLGIDFYRMLYGTLVPGIPALDLFKVVRGYFALEHVTLRVTKRSVTANELKIFLAFFPVICAGEPLIFFRRHANLLAEQS